MGKKKFSIILVVLIFLLMLSSLSFAENHGDVYVIPIEGEINKATYNFLRDSISKIDLKNARAIIFEINTYGGLVDQASDIKDLIVSLPVHTISYVNNKAISAGVLVTIASENVVMSSSATIGSAETVPFEEKSLSMWRGFLRDTAQYRGRDAEIVESMADKDIEIEGIVEEGKLLNLTSKEALEHGISDVTADTYEEILRAFDLESANIKMVDESLQVKLAKIIANPYISSFLLTLGFIGLVIEIMTPGFGLGGTISIIGFGLYFGGNILAGNSNWTSLILFVTGLILLIVEAIVPGFGLPGIGGILFLIVGIVLAVDSVTTALFSLSIAIIITTIITVILFKQGYRSKHLSKLILKSNLNIEKGYLSTDSMDIYLDKIGTATTELRPSGFIEIEGIKLDALAESGHIARGSTVKVVRVEGSKIFVRRSN
ncbi:MAG TPA: NfeD family protein [Tissierellaceae bacterium]|nr:NfeD family protein [Tissierellaceae bacterium]